MSQIAFQFLSKTAITFGNGSLQLLAEELTKRGLQKPLLLTDNGLIESGLVKPISKVLENSDIAFKLFSDIPPNPPSTVVHTVVDQINQNGCDAIIAIGGGSVIDTAKAASVLSMHDGDILEYESTRSFSKPGLPLLVIPTTSGTGSEVTMWSVGTDTWSLLPEEATYIHIDIDPEEIDRNYPSVRMVGDAKATLQALYDALQATGANPFQHQRANIEKTIQTAKDYHTDAIQSLIQDNPNTMNMETFLRKIDPLLDNDSVIVADASLSSVWNANYLTARANRKFIFPRGLAGLGWGLPMAMGAKLAKPRKKVFCLVGDGGFAHVWSELETCKRHGIEVVVVVINNQILGYQKISETVAFNRSTNVCDFSAVDHTKIAEACGLHGIKLDQVSDIYDTMTAAFQHEGTVVIDLIADPDNIPPVASMESYKREVTT